MLDAAAIVTEAEARASIADSERPLRPNLDQLVASLNAEARLSPRGEASAQQAIE